MVDEKLQIKKININDIVPADYNPRQISEHDYQKLANSINEFGVVDPIIINLNDNTIIGGHQRFDVLFYDKNITDLYLLELGDIGWVFPDSELIIKDKDHEKALNLALNKISGEWNIDKLDTILEELDELNLDGLTGFDISLNEISYEFIRRDDDGYEDFEEEEDLEVSEEYHETDEIIVDDDNKVEPVKRSNKPEIIDNSERTRRTEISNFVKKGDMFQVGNNYIVCGDINDENLRTRMSKQKMEVVDLDIPSDYKLFSEEYEFNYYISDDADLIEEIIIENKNDSKKIW